MLIRHGQPSKLDHAPRATICKVLKHLSDDCEVYVQINEDDSDPRWEYVGVFSPEKEDAIMVKVNQILSFIHMQD